MLTVDCAVSSLDSKLEGKVVSNGSQPYVNKISVELRDGPCYNGVTNGKQVDEFYDAVNKKLQQIRPDLKINYVTGTNKGPCGTTWTFTAPSKW